MKPGTHRGKPVVVSYSIPIRYNIVSNDKEIFPVHRGCEKEVTNLGMRKCSIKKIKDFIKLSFDYDIADRALPTEKSTQFKVDFVVDEKGKVKDVTAKANHKAIAIEAIKATKRLPKFKKPGYINDVVSEIPVSLTMIIHF